MISVKRKKKHSKHTILGRWRKVKLSSGVTLMEEAKEMLMGDSIIKTFHQNLTNGDLGIYSFLSTLLFVQKVIIFLVMHH